MEERWAPRIHCQPKSREGPRDYQLGANTTVRALLATPLLELDIEHAKHVIEEAEEANVLPSLIDKAVEHTQDAAEAQMSASQEELL